MTTRTAGRVVGALILSGFFLYGGGSFLVASTADSGTALPENAASLSQLTAGSTMLLLNSVAVAIIGALAFRVLSRHHRRTARLYLATRTVEAVLLALAPVGTLALTLVTGGRGETVSDAGSGLHHLARTAVATSESAYWLAMATLGVGSVFFCRALLRSALLPRVLAVWGMVGYAIFALGGVLQLLGYGVGLPLSAPGGLFEVTAGSYLLAKGFGAATPQAGAETHPTPRTTSIAASTSHATS